MKSEPQPTAFVVDDDPGTTQSLRWLFKSAGVPVETFRSAYDFLAVCTPARCGCLVTDIRMPGMSGLDLQEQLSAQGITMPVIIITGHADVPGAIRAMKHGAIDFIEKPLNQQQLLERVQQALRVAELRHQQHVRRAEIKQRIAALTPREREVMTLVAAGNPNKRIAAILGRSPKTVEIHRANVMRKMRVDSLAELVRLVEESAGGTP